MPAPIRAVPAVLIAVTSFLVMDATPSEGQGHAPNVTDWNVCGGYGHCDYQASLLAASHIGNWVNGYTYTPIAVTLQELCWNQADELYTNYLQPLGYWGTHTDNKWVGARA